MVQDLDTALRRLSAAPLHPGLESIEGAELGRLHAPPTSPRQGIGLGAIAAAGAAHAAMGVLQKETRAHIFARRQSLRPDQARKFDAAVGKALTVDAR